MNDMNLITRHAGPSHLPLSRAVQAGGFLFLSGVLPVDTDGRPLAGTIGEEAEAVLQHIQRVLESLGASLTSVVRATIWLADLRDFHEFNAVYERYFAGALPARSTVQAMLNRGARIEVEVQAWCGGIEANCNGTDSQRVT
jgi:2-iminobutanoate/2-iminopropanoate deaminase